MNPISEVLNKAADLLEPEGAWCKGELRKGHESQTGGEG